MGIPVSGISTPAPERTPTQRRCRRRVLLPRHALHNVRRLPGNARHDVLEALPAHDRVRLHLRHARRVPRARVAVARGDLLVLLARGVAQYAALLRDALHEPHADRRVPRVHVADVVLELLERVRVLDQQPQRLAQRRVRVLARGGGGGGRRQGVRQQDRERRRGEREQQREIVVAI